MATTRKATTMTSKQKALTPDQLRDWTTLLQEIGGILSGFKAVQGKGTAFHVLIDPAQLQELDDKIATHIAAANGSRAQDLEQLRALLQEFRSTQSLSEGTFKAGIQSLYDRLNTLTNDLVQHQEAQVKNLHDRFSVLEQILQDYRSTQPGFDPKKLDEILEGQKALREAMNNIAGIVNELRNRPTLTPAPKVGNDNLFTRRNAAVAGLVLAAIAALWMLSGIFGGSKGLSSMDVKQAVTEANAPLTTQLGELKSGQEAIGARVAKLESSVPTEERMKQIAEESAKKVESNLHPTVTGLVSRFDRFEKKGEAEQPVPVEWERCDGECRAELARKTCPGRDLIVSPDVVMKKSRGYTRERFITMIEETCGKDEVSRPRRERVSDAGQIPTDSSAQARVVEEAEEDERPVVKVGFFGPRRGHAGPRRGVAKCPADFSFDPKEGTCTRRTYVSGGHPKYDVPREVARCVKGTTRTIEVEGPYGRRTVHQTCR